MKPARVASAASALAFAAAALACGGLPAIRVPSLMTREARTAVAATVEAGGDLRLEGGPTVGSVETTRAAMSGNPPFLEMLAPEQYTSEELSQPGETYTYTIQLDQEQTLFWGTNWCTTTEAISDQNFQHIRLEFSVDGVPIDPRLLSLVETSSDGLFCRYIFTTVHGWPQGDTKLEIKVTFEQNIDDGMGEYPKGTHYYQYTVTRP